MNTTPIIVYDFETVNGDALHPAYDPYTCLPVQVAAVVIDPRKLEVFQNGTFSSLMKPDVSQETWENADKIWAEAINVHKKTVDILKQAPDEAQVWKNFVQFVNNFNPKKNQFNAPISAGQNIDKFDCIIADRLNKKHKVKESENVPLLFSTRTSIDLKNILFMWFEGNNELKNYKMDTLRTYLDMNTEGSHDALVDVQQTAEVIIRFLKLHRNLFPSIPFKGAFSHKK